MSIDARFRVGKGDFVLDVEMSLPEQGITAIFGPSGSGKTTLLRAVAGLERTAEGYFNVAGSVWQDEKQFLEPHQRSLGYVFQEPGLFDHLTVRRNLEYGYKRVRARERRLRFDEVVDLLGLESLLTRRPQGLSGGERQRVAIGRALLTSPSLVLMDEPLSGLDSESKNEIFPFLERLHRELSIPVLFVSHARDEVARLADHLVLMSDGRIIADGPVGDMLTRVDLPLAHGFDAESIIEGRVAAQDDDFGLTRLETPGGLFSVTRIELPIGRSVRLRILARDVSLTLDRQSKTSILNIFPARVAELGEEGQAGVLVKLLVGGVPVLSSITRKSAGVLDLKPGSEVFAQVKSVAVLR